MMKHSIVPQVCIYTHKKRVRLEKGTSWKIEFQMTFIFLLILFCTFQIWGVGVSMCCLHNQEIQMCWPGMVAHAYNLRALGLRQEDSKSKASMECK